MAACVGPVRAPRSLDCGLRFSQPRQPATLVDPTTTDSCMITIEDSITIDPTQQSNPPGSIEASGTS